MSPTSLSLLVFAVALPAALPAHAQIYRWVDDQGVVNYANKPPASGQQTTRIDTQESRVSIIPIVSPTVRGGGPPPLPPGPASGGFPGAVDRLTISNSQAALEWRERCFAERRVDCTNPTSATYDFVVSHSPSPLGAAMR
jgi:hypothetical protein